MEKNSRTLCAISAMAILAIMCGCMTSQLEEDPSYSYVGGRTYTANMKKLQAYAKSPLPECSGRNGKFCVTSANILDLNMPLKMVVFDGSVGREKEKDYEWQLFLYHVLPDAGKGAEVVTTVLRSDSKRMDQLIRKEIIKYIKEGTSTECEEWRAWASNTNYAALATQAPHIMFDQCFQDMVRKDLQAPIYEITEQGFAKSVDLSSGLSQLQEQGIIDVVGNGRLELDLAHSGGNGDAKIILNSGFTRLAQMVSEANYRSTGLRYEIGREMSKRVMAKKLALKKQIDVATARKRAEEKRIAEEKKRAEERRRQEEAVELQRQQAEDGRALVVMDETIATWKRNHKQEIDRILSSKNVMKGLTEFVKENGGPTVVVPAQLHLSANVIKAKSKVELWNHVKSVNWELIAGKNSLERAKQIYSLEAYCNALDERIWKAVLKCCAADEAVSFNKKFAEKEIPTGNHAVDVILASQHNRYMFNRPMEFVKGTMYHLIERPFFGNARVGALFDEDTRAYNVAVRIGAYMSPDGDSDRTEMVVISGLGPDCVTGESLGTDVRVIYKGPIRGKNGYGNTITARHFELFDAKELNLADVSEFDIIPGRKGVKIDDEYYNFYFTATPLEITTVVSDENGQTSTNRHFVDLVVADHKVGDSFIVRKKTELKTIIAREGRNVIGMFGVRFGVEVKDLLKENVGTISEPTSLPESEGGGLSFKYDYQGNRGVWDEFAFETGGEKDPTIRRVEAAKSYTDETKALSDVQDFLELLKNRYGIPTAKNPMAKDGKVWLQIFEQEHNTVLLSVKLIEKENKYHLTYSLLSLAKKKE